MTAARGKRRATRVSPRSRQKARVGAAECRRRRVGPGLEIFGGLLMLRVATRCALGRRGGHRIAVAVAVAVAVAAAAAAAARPGGRVPGSRCHVETAAQRARRSTSTPRARRIHRRSTSAPNRSFTEPSAPIGRAIGPVHPNPRPSSSPPPVSIPRRRSLPPSPPRPRSGRRRGASVGRRRPRPPGPPDAGGIQPPPPAPSAGSAATDALRAAAAGARLLGHRRPRKRETLYGDGWQIRQVGFDPICDVVPFQPGGCGLPPMPFSL